MKIKLITTHKVLSPTLMTVADYAVNPYRGCEFNCLYCYAQFMKTAQKEKNTLGVKENAPFILEKELKNRKVKRVVLGSSCESMTYAEEKYRITEKILEILNTHEIAVTILTKSPFITEYADLIGKNSQNRIFFTYNFSDETTKTLFEHSSPGLAQRIKAMAILRKKGIRLRAHIGPYLPYVSDLNNIFAQLAMVSDTINIELYHNKMGNFDGIIGCLKNGNRQTAENLYNVYASEKKYYDFSRTLKEDILNLNRKYGFTVYYIEPQYGDYYNSRIDYEHPLV
ncbi:MAG: radical SAM protein [Candidatus Omnitrophica bacterium]|nr:radical SAM protein [Candidatus Omnitrophota bacterium]